MESRKVYSAQPMVNLSSPQGTPHQGRSIDQGAPMRGRFTLLGTPLPSPQHAGTLRTLLEAPRACTSAVQMPRRNPPSSSQRKSNTKQKRSSKNEAARTLYSSAQVTASASPAPSSSRGNPSYQPPSPLDVRQFNSASSTSQISRTSYGAPVPSAFYVRDISTNDRRSEAEKFVHDVWRE